ncbi:PBSX family phage terminase large subunit [Mesobacillus subterraneus]|uniref:PBSX family phage terminase large subunit n=1 Tax=Mesobacillus subterraneus TaxID=285983 RepID=UPI00273FB8FF|nr:PBSX family phage terminase large subunit [Mesobacillus subterraneus]WLR54845.1 PBSX family phage terminase large subunit [Mesobacillus subterraneus]
MSVTFSEKQLKTIRAPFDVTLDVNEGTPRSGKTTAGHFRYAYYLSVTPDENHLIAAYNQEQAYRLFIDGDGTGLKHIFGDLCKTKHDELGDHLEVHTPSGIKKVYYKGGGKVDSVKVITGMSLGSVVFCEINLLHMDMIQECFRRTFAARMRYHLADLNPPAPNHPVIEKVFDVQKTRWQHWTIQDNPIISEERKKDIYETLKKNPYLLQRDWEGKRVMPEGVIYGMFDMDKHIKQTLLGEPYEMYFTADGGQSDATSCSCNIVTRYEGKFRLNRVAHYYHSGKETGQVKAMSVYAKEIKEFVQWCVEKFQMRYSEFFVDPACKSLREELRLVGVATRGANNNAKDVKGTAKGIEVGIERAQNSLTNEQFFLVENDQFGHYHFIKEVGMYCRDDKGKPIDDFNHALDEFRYSNNYFYKRYVI